MAIETRNPQTITAASTSPVQLSAIPGVVAASWESQDDRAVTVTCSAGAMLAYRLEGSNDAGHTRYVPLMDDVISYDIPTTFRATLNAGVAYTNYTTQVTDGDAATHAPFDALDTIANGDWGVCGYSTPFNGVFVDMGANVNAIASVLTVQYWNGVAWTAVAGQSDGTANPAGTPFAQDGNITWTMPADWRTNIVDGVTAYHVRISVSVILSATVDLNEVRPLLDANRHVAIVMPVSAIRIAFNGVTGAETIVTDSVMRARS